jgi:hypothetical protein
MSYQNISAAISDQDMESIKKSLDSIDSKLSFLIHLTPTERHDLFKMGDKSLAFVKNSMMAAQQNRDILPVSFDLPEFEKDFQLIQDLTEILTRLHQITEEVDDTLIAVGSEAMRSSLTVYDYVKTASKNQPGLKTLAEQLGERFKAIGQSRRRNLAARQATP